MDFSKPRRLQVTSKRDHLVAAALLLVIIYIYCYSVHYKTMRPFPPSLSLPLFPCCCCCCCCPDTMVVSRRCIQESFCQPVYASLCTQTLRQGAIKEREKKQMMRQRVLGVTFSSQKGENLQDARGWQTKKCE